ncbi:MAG: sigma-70 family RNA polymerase sigma factor [Planctomycetia bacterium]|nr:sigma-70 family RNA polymerase sigma factor [Planctomycetia bacterium]
MGQAAPDPPETLRLLDDVRAGDRSALDRLLAEHRQFLRWFVELRLDPHIRARVDASDVVQEAQLEAVRRVDNYLERPALPFRLWLRQIAFDRLLMARRQHVEADRRAVTREAPLPDGSSIALGQQVLAGGPTPSQHLARDEMAERVRRAVAELPEADREILLMRNFEGLTNLEAAQLLALDPATASKRYGRALLRLRQLLSDDGLTGGGA